MTEAENDDPVGSPDPLVVFTGLAQQAGPITANDVITSGLLAFTLIVDRCASIADAYGEGNEIIGSAADHLRASCKNTEAQDAQRGRRRTHAQAAGRAVVRR